MSCITVLKRNEIKLTLQRRLIVDALHNSTSHLTAEDIFEQVRVKAPEVNRSTVYRMLELLERLGCVVKSELGDRLIYHHTEEGHHHHLVCRQCGRSIYCDEGVMSSLDRELNKKYCFKADLKHLVITGLCQACQDNN